MTTIDTSTALLPCPFCGGEVWYQKDHTTECRDSIWCRNCDFGMFDPDDEGSVVAAWNRRTLVPALLKERDEARARAAAAFEMANDAVLSKGWSDPYGLYILIRDLPTDQERDALAKVRAEAMREAADWLVTLETAAGEADLSERREGIRDAASAILNRADQIEKGEM